MQDFNPQIHKMFIVDYRFINNGDRRIHSHFTYAASRKCAENQTRDMEAPERMNIIKITPVLMTKDVNDAIDEALATHIENNQAYMETLQLDELDTYH